MRIVVEKYHGLGNDYLVYDPNKNKLKLTPSNVQLMCNRNFGVGADGILEGPVLDGEQISMVVWNPDGSVAQKSGNGVRIFAKYLKDAGYVQKKDFTISSQGGEASIHYLNEEGTRLKASMGKVSFWSDDVPVEGPRREIINETMVFGRIPYPVTCLSIGNPHCVILMDEISKDLVCRIGRYSESARQFPEKINTQIMKVLDPYPDRSVRTGSGLHTGFRQRLLCGCGCGLPSGAYGSQDVCADAGRHPGAGD